MNRERFRVERQFIMVKCSINFHSAIHIIFYQRQVLLMLKIGHLEPYLWKFSKSIVWSIASIDSLKSKKYALPDTRLSISFLM